MGSDKMANSYLHFLPAATFIALPSTFVVTYFWSVKEDHVYPVLPDISETGALPPESCFFGMMINLSAFIMLFSVYVRHKEVVEVFRVKRMADTIPSASTFNKASTITGIVACASLDVVGNFQESFEVGYIHEVAAIVCFYSSALYLLQQAVLTRWMVPEISGMWLVYTRWFLGIVAAMSVVGNTIASSISMTLFLMERKEPSFTNKTTHWTPSTPGYNWHCTSSVLEWTIVCTLGTYILTFCWDFRKITISEPELEIEEDPVPEPVKTVGFKVQENHD